MAGCKRAVWASLGPTHRNVDVWQQGTWAKVGDEGCMCAWVVARCLAAAVGPGHDGRWPHYPSWKGEAIDCMSYCFLQLKDCLLGCIRTELFVFSIDTGWYERTCAGNWREEATVRLSMLCQERFALVRFGLSILTMLFAFWQSFGHIKDLKAWVGWRWGCWHREMFEKGVARNASQSLSHLFVFQFGGSAAGGPVPSTIWDSEHGMFFVEFSRKASSVHPNNWVSAEFGTPLLHRWPGANAQYGPPWGQRIAMSMYDSRAHGLKRLLGMKAACGHGLSPGASLQLWGGVMVLTSPTTRAGKGRPSIACPTASCNWKIVCLDASGRNLCFPFTGWCARTRAGNWREEATVRLSMLCQERFAVVRFGLSILTMLFAFWQSFVQIKYIKAWIGWRWGCWHREMFGKGVARNASQSLSHLFVSQFGDSAAGGPVSCTIWDSEHGMFLWNLAERRAAFTLTIE